MRKIAGQGWEAASDGAWRLGGPALFLASGSCGK